ANAVDAGSSNPPQGVLNQVARHLRIVLVQIRKDVDEASIQRALLHLRGGMRIDQRPGAPGFCQVLRRGAVEPGGSGRVLHPRVVRTGVIGHLILYHLQALGVRLVHQLTEFLQVAEVLIDAIEIHRTVAVIIRDGLIVVAFAFVQVVDVVVYRSEPERGDAQILQIRKVLRNAGEIAAMVVAALDAIVQSAADGGIVVGGVAVGEAVRHDEVDHVVAREALKAPGRRQWRDHREWRFNLTFGGGDFERIFARYGRLRNAEIHEQMGPALTHLDGTGAKGRAHRGPRQVPARHQHAQRDALWLHGPVRRFYFRDYRRGGIRETKA